MLLIWRSVQRAKRNQHITLFVQVYIHTLVYMEIGHWSIYNVYCLSTFSLLLLSKEEEPNSQKVIERWAERLFITSLIGSLFMMHLKEEEEGKGSCIYIWLLMEEGGVGVVRSFLRTKVHQGLEPFSPLVD